MMDVTLDKKALMRRLTICVEPEQSEALGKLAALSGLSKGEIVRRWLSYAIQQTEHAHRESA